MNTDNPYEATAAAIELITRKGHDDCRLKAYLCPANRVTIGYGHVILPKFDYSLFRVDAATLARILDECQKRRVITQEAQVVLVINQDKAKQLLYRDVDQVALFLRSVTSVLINQNQFDALVSFIFNVGQGRYAQSTLRHKLHDRDFAGAAAEFDRWVMGTVDGVKKPLPGLVTRRAAERALFETPDA